MAAWTKGTMHIAVAEGREERTGYVRGVLGIYKSDGGGYWNVTHLPSGLAAMTVVPKLKDCKARIKQLAELGITDDWWNKLAACDTADLPIDKRQLIAICRGR